MAPYSMDIRTRVLRDSDAGMPSKDVAAKYSVSRAWVDRVNQRRREHGELVPRKQTSFRRWTLSAAQEQRLVVLVTATPDATLADCVTPTPAAVSTIWRVLGRLGPHLQKNVHADEQRRPDVAVARRQWRTWQPLGDVRQYVFRISVA